MTRLAFQGALLASAAPVVEPGPPGFAVIEATATSTENAATTSHTVALPADIQAGDMLMLLWSAAGASSISPPSGWTEALAPGVRNGMEQAVYVRLADGEEGLSLGVTTGNSRRSSHIVYRLSNHNLDLSEGLTGVQVAHSAAQGEDAFPDPPESTAAWGAADNLFIAFCTIRDGNRPAPTPPANYGAVLHATPPSTGSSTRCTISSARRELAAAMDDPGAFEYATAEFWAAFTIIVAPAGA